MRHIENAYNKLVAETAGEVPVILDFIKLENVEDVKGVAPIVSFTIQSDPIGEVGVNGCQALDMLKYTKCLFQSLNDAFPCRENALTITKIEEAIHWQEAISKNSYVNLTSKQIKEIIIEEKIKHYYESTAIRGTVTRIGGKTIDSNPKILISKYDSDIEITNEQEEALKEFYKNGILEFYIVQKVNSETHHIESAILEDFVIVSTKDTQERFADSINDLRLEHGSIIAEYLNNFEHE